jgi:CDP-diacylglycerol--serine O-phosphatidyltransferase
MSLKRHIPNFLTCCSLACGCVALVQISVGNLALVPPLVWLAAFFDFTDGFAARMLKTSSAMGKELDSISDMVSFGVVPGFLMFSLIMGATDSFWLPYFGFLITIFSALRLAKFNIDTRQSDKFIGLPTPANALFITGLLYIIDQAPATQNSIYLIAITVIFSYLLVAELPLIALKFKNFSFKDNSFRYLLVLISVLALLVFGLVAISPLIILYIILSVVDGFLSKKGE